MTKSYSVQATTTGYTMPLVKAAKVVLPEFYIAFVLPNASREPTKKECEELRAQSIDFWTKRLNEVYSKTFKKLDLKFEKRIFGERPKMNNLADDLAPEFNMYLEVSGKALFSNKSTPPTYDMVFHQMAEGDSMDYLVEFVRKVKKDPSLFATAVEVRAKRLKVDPKGPGGTVKSPSFFVAFSTDPTLDPPTEEEVEEFRKRTHDNIVHHLKAKYPTNFVSCELKVTNVEVGQEKPDERFHLYLENECSATFSSNAPTEEELFSIILRCCNTRDYLMIMSTIDGSPFMTVTRVKCQMIGLDAPQAPEELKEPPKKEEPEKEEEEKEQEQEEGSEDEDDQEGEEDEDKEKPKDEPKDEPNIIEIDVPVFLALVVMAEPPAELPSQGELMEFHSLMERIFYTVLKNEYPDTLIDTTLKEKQTQFDAGVPEPRFNMCVEYDAHLRFKPGEPEPDKKKIKMLIIEMNLSTILAHVRKLEPLCFRKTTEVTMTQKQEKRGASIDPDEDIFEAAIDAPLALPPPEEKEEEEPPLALPPSEKEEVKEPVQTLPVLPLEEEKKKPQKIKLEPEKEKPKEEPQPEPEEPPKKEKKPKKKRESKKVKPKKESKAGKLNHDYAQVQSSDIYVALKLDDVDLSPTPEDFEKLRQETREFFMWRLKEFFPTQFVKLDLAFVTYEFGAGKPDSRYNVYVEWDIRASFVKSLTETEPAKEVVGNQRVSMKLVKDGLPTPYELTRALVQNVPLKDYLLKYVRQIRGTGFETTTAGYFQQRVT